MLCLRLIHDMEHTEIHFSVVVLLHPEVHDCNIFDQYS
jgi:hypothetical protein